MSFGAEYILRDVSFRLGESDKVGLVGPNGEGKSTLLKILAGQLEPVSGSIHMSRGLTTAYLPQDPPAPPGKTVDDAIEDAFAALHDIEREIHEITARLGRHDENDMKRLGELQTQFEVLGGYDHVSRVQRTLSGLNFPDELRGRRLDELSGGQRTRASLAALLLKNPDFLMLDEPTNHLDIEATQWLEDWLKNYAGVLVVVSHDRYFLDSVTNSTWQVARGGVETYRGCYSEFLPKRQQRYEERMRIWTQQQEYIAETRDFINRHIAGQRTKEAQGRRTRLERFIAEEAIEKPVSPETMSLKLRTGKTTGDIVMRAEDIAVGYSPAQPLVKAEKLEIVKGRRVAIVGANGIGKTTLLRSILGELELLGGKVTLGANVVPGYLSQAHTELAQDMTAMEAVMALGCTGRQAMDALGAMQLGDEAAARKISELSGGQRSRVILARLLLMESNLLMLDEPTNHLDMPSVETLQQALADFEGSVLFVSHDRYLIEKIATDIWIVADGTVKTVSGGWQAYLDYCKNSAGNPTSPQQENKSRQADKEKRKEQYRQSRQRNNLLQKLQKQHSDIETDIDSLERRLAGMNDEISSASVTGDMQLVEKLSLDYQACKKRLDELWVRWEDVGNEIQQHCEAAVE